MKKIKINNLEDLRFRKLYLRSEIKMKEQQIKKDFRQLRNNVQDLDLKNDIINNIIQNPAIAINTARITYDIITRIRRWRRQKKNRN
ncbi:MAG TPA: hypothetical protein PLI65_07910 [Bacteroidales bacterium]|nr:hypothetical protein [Bacteroidales bacterium]HPR58105.1 hypothetical protein [Bacteroidales bacterium]